jgi:hypothetical protein
MNTPAHVGAAHRVRSLVAIALLALVAALFGATSARAAGVTGPVDTSGMPIWYQDATGLRLAPCLLGPPLCFGTLADLGANGGEAFYANANTSLTDPSGASFTVVLAVEAANLNGGLITFGRIRVVGKGLAPNTTYTVSEPYGSIVLTSDAGGIAKDTTDIGCGAAPCAFDAALGSPVFGGFLQWDTTASAPPLGFIGDNVTPHKVVGSPLARNFVSITGGGLSLFTDQFVVEGELAAGATPPGMLPPATPLAPQLLPADDTGASHTDNITKVASPTIVGSTRAGANVTATVDGVVNGTGKALGDGSYSIKLPIALADGTHAITVTAANPLSGAASPASPSLTITLDTTAPAVLAAPKTAQPLSASVGAFFTGTAEAGTLVSLFSDGDPIGNGPASGGAYSIKANALGTGLHHITATATDVAGNTSASSDALSLPVGSVSGIQPPALSASSDSGSSSSDGITNVAQPTFVGSVALTSATVKLFADGNVIGTGTAAGGAYSINASSRLGDGQHLITVIVTDNASGLESAPSAPLRIMIDTVAPAAPSRPVETQAFTSAGTVAVSGIADAGSTVAVYVDDRHAASGSASAGSWSATLAGLAPGSHKIDATATDLAGNTSPRSEPLMLGAAKATKPVNGPAVVAVGAVPVARFRGHIASVTATVTVDKRSRLAVSAAAPGGRALTLLRGSTLGSTVQRVARASSLHTTVGAASRVRIELRIDRAQLSHPGLYRIVVGATDRTGHATKLRIALRVR